MPVIAHAFRRLESRPRGRLAARLAPALLLSGLLAAPAAGQSPRLQVAWVDDQVLGPLVGIEGRTPIGSEPEQPASGPIVMQTRDWMLTGEAAVGVNLNPDDADVEVLLYLHGGVLYRTGSDMLSRVGGVVAAYLPAGVVGPAARVELAGAVDVQAGWLFKRGHGHLHLALDVSTRFLCDLFC